MASFIPIVPKKSTKLKTPRTSYALKSINELSVLRTQHCSQPGKTDLFKLVIQI